MQDLVTEGLNSGSGTRTMDELRQEAQKQASASVTAVSSGSWGNCPRDLSLGKAMTTLVSNIPRACRVRTAVTASDRSIFRRLL